MFTIDLLKGQGIPMKSRPESIAISAITFTVPVLIAIVMLGLYLSNSVAMSIHSHSIANYETRIGELSDAVELQRAFERERNAINGCMAEVSSSTGRHIQWSPVLVTVVENMPDSMILTRLDTKQRSVKRKVPKKDDPKKKVDISLLVRELQMNVSGKPQDDCDKAVKDFRNRLLSSPLLGPKLEDIRVSQKHDTLDGQDAISYEINCIFKPEEQ